MSQPNDASSFFGGGSNGPKMPPALRFYPGPHVPMRSPDVGYVAGGVILEIIVRQQYDFDNRKPKVWDDSGKPMMEALLIVQTALSGEPYLENTPDDGRRTIYVRGQMEKAITEAVRKAGDADGVPKVGGDIQLRCLSTYSQEKRKRLNTWEAKYTPGAAPTGDFFGGGQAVPQQRQAAPTAAQAAYAHTTGMSTLDQIRSAQPPAGFEDEPPF